MNAVISHTEGFWEASIPNQYVYMRHSGWIIADCRDTLDNDIEVSANVRLIAAAPDLLDVAMSVLNHATVEMPQALIAAAELAVSKATRGAE